MTVNPNEDAYAIILAGGSGTRFWPVSRELLPKQLCPIADPDRTMIEVTLDRLDGLIPPERRVIVTHAQQIAKTKTICGSKAAHYLAEPDRRDTANAIALAAEFIVRTSGNPQAIMLSLHSDHVIEPAENFQRDLVTAMVGAREGKLVLIGAPPTRPDTGFGYLELSEREIFPKHFEVTSFKEKPDRDTAQEYLARGNFLWNTGLFCWRCDVIHKELGDRLPGTVKAISAVKNLDDPKDLTPVYGGLPKISIDHAVLEVSKNVCALKGSFSWRDIGSWQALWEYTEKDGGGNCVPGGTLALDCQNTLISSFNKKFIAAVGLENLAIVDTEDALLVCDLDSSQKVKEVVNWLAKSNRQDLV